VNEADGQLRAAHLILGYTPLSFGFQAPKCVIRARDPRLRRISVAYEGFIVPEGIPLPEHTPLTEPLSVASVSAGLSLPSPSLKKKGTNRRRKREKSKQTVVTVSESTDDFEIFDQPSNPEESSDEMGVKRIPQKSLMELIGGQQGKSAPAQTVPSQVSSLPARSPPPVPRHPPQSSSQTAPPSIAEPEKRREQKGKGVADASKSRPTREEDVQRAAKQQKTRQPSMRGQEKSDSPHPDSQAWLPVPMLGGEPLRDDASVRDYNGGIGCHVASAIEEALLLPKDMAELKNVRKNQLILDNKRYLGMVRSCLFYCFIL